MTPQPQEVVLIRLANGFNVSVNRIPDLKTIYHSNKHNATQLITAISHLPEQEQTMMLAFIGAVVGGFVTDVPSPIPELKRI